MLEIIALLLALGAIAGFARGRGASPFTTAGAQHANICEACEQPWKPALGGGR